MPESSQKILRLVAKEWRTAEKLRRPMNAIECKKNCGGPRMALDQPSKFVLLSRGSRHSMSDLNRAEFPASTMVDGNDEERRPAHGVLAQARIHISWQQKADSVPVAVCLDLMGSWKPSWSPKSRPLSSCLCTKNRIQRLNYTWRNLASAGQVLDVDKALDLINKGITSGHSNVPHNGAMATSKAVRSVATHPCQPSQKISYWPFLQRFDNVCRFIITRPLSLLLALQTCVSPVTGLKCMSWFCGNRPLGLHLVTVSNNV